MGYSNNQGPDEVTKNWQKTEAKDTEDNKQTEEHRQKNTGEENTYIGQRLHRPMTQHTG